MNAVTPGERDVLRLHAFALDFEAIENDFLNEADEVETGDEEAIPPGP